MRGIFSDKCWVVHIPFVCMVEFKFLTHFRESPYRPCCVSSYTPAVLICYTPAMLSLLISLLFYSFQTFSHQHQPMASHWNLNGSKSPQVSRTFLSFLVDLNNAVVWMVSTRPLMSTSSRSCNNPVVTIPSELITIGIIATFKFQIFSVLWQCLGAYLSFVIIAILLL